MKYSMISLSFLMLLMSGCGSTIETPSPAKKETPQTVEKKTLPPPPKSTHKPKEVKDTNYETSYMYPEDNKKKKESTDTSLNIATQMSKEECIEMVTKEKFDKYTAMFGSEEASIKRCQMIKAMSS